MCGISCIIALEERARRALAADKQQLSDRLDKSFEQIKHRGPDSTGKWISEDGRVALGHVRLDINDLSPSGHQPLSSGDDSVHCVVNGEIYEYSRLRAEMEEKINYKFKGTSDSELVLALYEYYGLSFLSHLRGEFSICLYDTKRELLIAIRDRYGIKPLFWTVQNGELLIAAEIKAFLPLGWKPEWNTKSIVAGDYQIGSSTIFKRVQKVRPGHVLTCRSFGSIHEERYWDSSYPDKHIKDVRTEEEMIQGVRDRLMDSIRERLRADVKVGVSLSGGIDSSVVAGVVNHLLREGHQIGSETENERLSCFGIAFDEDSGFDESSTANRTADFLGVKFHKKLMNEQALADMFEDATWHDELPNPDLNFIGTYALSELFREKGFRVNINGQGADEILGGYNILLPDFLREPDETFSGEKPSQELLDSSLASTTKTLLELYGLDSEPKSTPSTRTLNSTVSPTLMTLAYPSLPIRSSFLPLTATDPLETWTALLPLALHLKMTSSWHPLHTALYTFVHTHLATLLLTHLGDRGEMAHSIEGRTPFLDHHLTEYVNHLPPSMKIRYDEPTNEWVEKYVLREAGKPFITDEVYSKRKHPYSAPVSFEKGGPLHSVVSKLVTKENIESIGWLDWDQCDDLVDEAFGGKDKSSFRLVLCLAQWVVIAKKFGVAKAVSEDESHEHSAIEKGGNMVLG